MQAIIHTGGKPYTVSPDDVILVELLKVKVGEEVRFEDVRLITGENGTKVGTPRVEGAVVVGTVLQEVRGPKTRAVAFRRRKDSMTVRGHRQDYLKVKITGIEGA